MEFLDEKCNELYLNIKKCVFPAGNTCGKKLINNGFTSRILILTDLHILVGFPKDIVP